jgi:amidase
MSVLEYQALTIEGRDYDAAYSDYWNSTADEDGKSGYLFSGMISFL